MEPYQYVVYFQEIASSSTHEAINRKLVYLRKPATYLGDGYWNYHEMDKVCPLIKNWKAKMLELRKYSFYLGLNESPTILQSIREVRFPELTLINVQGNNIESVEGISRIHFPKLTGLWISTSVNMEATTKLTA